MMAAISDEDVWMMSGEAAEGLSCDAGGARLYLEGGVA